MSEVLITQACAARPELLPIATIRDGVLEVLSPCGSACVCARFDGQDVAVVTLGRTRASNYGFRHTDTLVMSNVFTDSLWRGVPLARRREEFPDVVSALRGAAVPHIVRLIDVCRCCTAVEFLEGYRLLDGSAPWAPIHTATSNWVDSRSPAEFERLLREVIGAVILLHRIGVVHTDVTGSNVLISADGDDFRIVDLFSSMLLRADADIETEIRQMQTFFAESVGRRWGCTWDVGRMYVDLAVEAGLPVSPSLQHRLLKIGSTTLDPTLQFMLRRGLIDRASAEGIARRPLAGSSRWPQLVDRGPVLLRALADRLRRVLTSSAARLDR